MGPLGTGHRVRMRLTEIIAGVYQLEFFRTSVFLVLEEPVTIVDAGWKGCGWLVLKTLERLGIQPRDIGYIVATHHHPDHAGGMAHLQEKTGALVAAHEWEVPVLEGLAVAAAPEVMRTGPLRWLTSPGFTALEAPRVGVDLPLAHGSRLETLGGLEVVHCPGHTPGSISLHFPREGLLLVGDALQFHRGQLELPSRWYTEDMATARESVLKLAELDFDTLGFSHFPPIRGNASQMLRELADSLN